MTVLFILQNGYHSEKYQYRNLQEWSEDLGRSHSGKRLMEMIPTGCDYYVINSTPEVGLGSSSLLKPQPDYILDWIDKVKPDVICACGKVAQNVCKELGINYVSAPHPAWRQLSKADTSKIRNVIMSENKNSRKLKGIEMVVVKITKPDLGEGGYYLSQGQIKNILGEIESMMDCGEDGESLLITVEVMPQEKFDSLVEFTGW